MVQGGEPALGADASRVRESRAGAARRATRTLEGDRGGEPRRELRQMQRRAVQRGPAALVGDLRGGARGGQGGDDRVRPQSPDPRDANHLFLEGRTSFRRVDIHLEGINQSADCSRDVEFLDHFRPPVRCPFPAKRG